MSEARNDSVPMWWILVFLLLTLGVGAFVVTEVGGSLVTSAGVVLPLL
jgi:hypothetical protein